MSFATDELQYSPIQRDGEDKRYAMSFDLGSCSGWDGAGLTFFKENGFIVVRNVFTQAECEESRAALWSIIEKSHVGFLRSVLFIIIVRQHDVLW